MPTRPSFSTAIAAGVVALGLASAADAQKSASSPAAPGNTATPSATTAKSGGTGAQSSSLSAEDRKFIEKAAAGGMAEVETGQLAQQKASHDAVKQFGARMVQDHGKANDELKQLASSKGVQLPPGPDKPHMDSMQKLQKASGAQFDREYMQHMLADHKKDVAEFQKQSKSAKDPDVKAFAAKTLPTLQEHLKQAQTVADSVKTGKNGAKSG